MSSTPIYDELAATYLADLTPEASEPGGADRSDLAAPAPTRAVPRTPVRSRPSRERPKV